MLATQIRFRLIVGIATALGACAAATSYVAAHDWFGQGDLPALLTWSLPPALATALLLPALAPRLSRAGVAITYLTLLSAGVLVGILWSLVVAVVFGPWLAAFTFPLFLCWATGGLLGGVAAAQVLRPRAWPLGAAAVLIAAIGLRTADTYQPPPEVAIRVILQPHATQAQIDQVWTTVLGHRAGRGDEHYLLPSLSSVGGAVRDGTSPVLIAQFRRGTSRHTRDSVVAAIRRSPLVLRVDSTVAQ